MPENPSAITREQVAHLGRLARLTLTDDELDHYSSSSPTSSARSRV